MAKEPSVPANLRQRQAAATQRQLLAAATEVFEDKGYQGTTIAAITDRANTAHGTFYLYFRNKEDAFCRVMEAVVVDELAAAARLPQDVPTRDAVGQAIQGFLIVYRRHGGLWRALLEGMLQSPRIQELWLDLRRRFINRLGRILELQQSQGLVRPLDSYLVAHALTAMTEWLAFTHFVLDEPPTAERSTEALAGALTDVWYHAIYG